LTAIDRPRIRTAEAGDASSVLALWTEAYIVEGGGGRTEPYAEADFFDLADRSAVFVAELEDEIVGVAALLPPESPRRAVASGHEAELARLAVAATARRAGVGRALTERCEERAREVGAEAIALWSRRYQDAAHRLYEERGYVRAPERDAVDETGHERLVFRLDLAPPLTARLEGSLVTLEPLSEAHAEGLWEAAQAAEIWSWLFNIGQSREWFDRWLGTSLEASNRGEEGPFATCRAADGRPIGSTRYLNVRRGDRVVEIGWTWLEPGAWGSGANAEAKLLMLRRAFEVLDCVRVEFKTDACNERSRAALATIPAQFEGVLRNHMIMPGIGPRDSAYYSVIDSEWPEVEANLERRLTRPRAPGR